MSTLLVLDGDYAATFEVDDSGRVIAPAQIPLPVRPPGAWDNNARADGSWAGPVVCSWCKATMRDGDRSLPVSHTICATCFEIEVA